MTAQFRWAEADYASAQWAWLKHHPVKLARALWYPIAIFIIVVVAAATANAPNWRNLSLVSLIAIGMVAFALLVQRWRWHRVFKKTPLFRDDVSATIDGQSIKLRGESFEATHYWGEFANVYESNRVFLLEKANNAFVFLPKAGMSQPQISELRSIIAANAKGKMSLVQPIP